jgi:hypothetical protein
MVFVSYVCYGIFGLPLLYGLLLGAWWCFIFPTLAILLAVYFRRAGSQLIRPRLQVSWVDLSSSYEGV